MPVKVIKDGIDYYLVPAPLVSYQKNFERLPNGQIVGVSYDVTLDGNILPNKGNPVATVGNASFETSGSWISSYSPDDDPLSSNDEEDLLTATIAKQQSILGLFPSGTSAWISIFGYGASSGITFFGNVQQVNFSNAGRWALPSEYQITLQTNSLDIEPESFSYYISDAQENWSIQESDQVRLNFNGYALESVNKVYQVSHTLSAVGKPVYSSGGDYLDGKAPWQQASGYVRSVIGLGNSEIPSAKLPSLFVSSSGYAVANRSITEQVNELAGSYEITEDYLVYKTGISPYAAIEEMSISLSEGEDGINSVEVQGTIQGLDTFQNTSESNKTNAYFNASGYFAAITSHAYNRALNLTGLDWLHPVYLTSTISRNPNQGSINYSYSYDDRPPNIISGSKTENISISDTYPGQNYASIPVIGRNQAVLQYLNSRTNYQRTLNIEVNMGRVTNNWGSGAPNGYWTNVTSSGVNNWLLRQKPSVTQASGFQIIFDAVNPANDSGVIQSKVFHNEPVESWESRSGRYSYSISWIYEKTTG